MQANPTTSAPNVRYGHYEGAMRKGGGVRTFVSQPLFNRQVPAFRADPDTAARAARKP